MKNMYPIRFILFLLFSLSQIAFAGGWSSCGGGFLKDSVNPWFLNNTKVVHYCVLIDQEHFGAREETVKLQLVRAINFWKEQFKLVVLPTFSKFGPLKIASQTFIETDCQSNTDLVFQFGVLDSEQKEYLKEPSEYGAVSVRTSYDELNLRGKGFVYLSPSSGPLSYDVTASVKDAWNVDEGRLIYLALLHELGHIFGLQHMGTYGDLMSQGFVESILANAESPRASEELNFFSLPKDGRLSCPPPGLLARWQKFFEAQESDKCFQFDFTHDLRSELFGKSLFTVSASESPESSLRKIQTVELSIDRFYPAFTSLIWLSKRQEVFSKDEISLINSGIPGISNLIIGKKGSFVSRDQKIKKSISVRFEQGRRTFFVDGVVDGSIEPIL